MHAAQKKQIDKLQAEVDTLQNKRNDFAPEKAEAEIMQIGKNSAELKTLQTKEGKLEKIQVKKYC